MSDGIGKRNGGDLWAEIKKLYESNAAPTYEKMKAILMAEFDLSEFPSKSTVLRRAKAENWQRSSGSPTAILYDDEFWEVVRAVYESYVKISYSELRELVQNSLQIDYFPTQAAVRKRQIQEGWKPLSEVNKFDDESIKKEKNQIIGVSKTIQDYIDQFSNQNKQDNDYKEEFIDKDDDYSSSYNYFNEKMNSNITKKNNLLMSVQQAKLEQVEFIEKSRFRMAKISNMGDELHDAWVRYYAAMTDPDFISMLDSHAFRVMSRVGDQLTRVTHNFSVLSSIRSNVIKNEFSLRGLTIEDVKDASSLEKYVPGEDAEEAIAFELQRQRLALEAKEAKEYRAYIESGQLEEDVERELAEATAIHDDDELLDDELE